MAKVPKSGDAPDDPQEPRRRPSPKRGAFPTPRSEIESAQRYVPGTDHAEDLAEPDPPADADREEPGTDGGKDD
jgi:hypothetical protein